eukprot:899503-Prymnesium_polylepis.1
MAIRPKSVSNGSSRESISGDWASQDVERISNGGRVLTPARLRRAGRDVSRCAGRAAAQGG